MGFLESVGVQGGIFGSLNIQSLGVWATFIFFIFVIVIIAGIGTFFYYSRKIHKQSFKNQIPIYQNINGKYHRIGIDLAKEVYIPDSNISLFYLKNKRIYIARPTKAMGKNEFWYSISENGEWVNFYLTSSKDQDTLAIANYDHRDTRYAYTNLKDIIKRNYSDKSIKWWKEYSHVITFIIVAFIFVGACWILLAKIGDLIVQLGPTADKIALAAENLNTAAKTMQNINSGVVGL